VSTAPKRFDLPGARPQYGPDHPVRPRHIDLLLEPDLAKHSLAATCTTTMEAVADGVETIELDAVDLEVERVWSVGDDGADLGQLSFRSRNATLQVRCARPLRRGELLRFAVRYRVVEPRRGVYFTEPDAARPDKPRQLWTQSQDQDARYWVPCLDYPDLKQMTSATVIVPRGLFALSNGALVERRDEGATTVFRYRQDVAHSTYLLSLVVGEFAEIAQAGASAPVYYYVPPGREADGERSFGATPKMMGVLEAFASVPYPYARYSQIAVADFIFGGMENTAATTQTDTTLHDERAHLDFTSDGLVSHELAHQWFGDLLTTRDWSHAWLNEGFASYCEAIYREADLGWDEYCHYLAGHRETYLGEYGERYARAIVTNIFRDPIELFDRHLYQKGSAVLHMLRGTLGVETFRRAIGRYVRDNAGGSVETLDLVRAIEAETGRNLREFFDQWVFRAGHVALRVAYRYDAEAQAAILTVEQKQAIDAANPAYRCELVVGFVETLPLAIARDAGDGALPGETRVRLSLERQSETFTVPMASEPKLVRIDPGAYLLATVAYEFGSDAHVAILEREPDIVARGRAATALAKDGSNAARRALVAALGSEPFWGTACGIAAALGSTRAGWAKEALLQATAHAHPKVRRAVAIALGAFRGDDAVVQALRGMRDDRSYFVAGEALTSLGKTRAPEAYEALIAGLGTPSWQDTIAAGAAHGLGESADERAIEPLIAATRENRTSPLRCAALYALARLRALLDGARPSITDAILALFDAPKFQVRVAAVNAAGRTYDPAALPLLRSIAEGESDGRLRRTAQEAIARIEGARTAPAAIEELRDELGRVRADLATVRDRLNALEP
jgi:aminopeptidase N